MTLSYLTKTLLAAGALSVLAAAPAAHAVENSSTKARFASTSAKVKARKGAIKNRVIRNNRSLRDNRRLGTTRSLRDNRLINNTRNFRNNRSVVRVNNFGFNSGFNSGFSRFGTSRFSSFGSPYRSALGISFNFGSPRYSGYRWGSSPFGFYNSSFGSFNRYKSSTYCHRVNRIGYHRGFEKLISVIECSNPVAV